MTNRVSFVDQAQPPIPLLILRIPLRLELVIKAKPTGGFAGLDTSPATRNPLFKKAKWGCEVARLI